MATWKGLEPSTSSVPGWPSTPLTYQAAFISFIWSDPQGSNLWPPACKAGALPAELWSRDNQMERVKGIEPSQPAWKAGTLPLSYTRMVTHRGIEPLLPPWKGGVLTAWPMSHIYIIKLTVGSKGGTRTLNLSVNSRVLHHWATLEHYVAMCYSPRRSPTKYHCR